MSSYHKISRFIRGFFIYNHSEKRGILVLTVLLLLYLGFQHYQIQQESSEEIFDHASFKQEIEEFIAQNEPESRKGITEAIPETVDSLFSFNPNKISRADAHKLGLSSRVVDNLIKFREKGGYFKHKADFKRIYGLKAADYNKLAPFIVIPENEPSKERSKEWDRVNYEDRWMVVVDVNTANDSLLKEVHGIGTTFAGRILNYRNKLGGFVRMEQLKEVYGINDEIYQQLAPQLTLGDTLIKRLNINTADAPQLIQHPYIDNWNLANAIVNFRIEHGAYSSPNQLLQLHLIDSSIFFRIRPYITVK